MRSGYTDDDEDGSLAMWRGRVASSMRGKRGQKLLRDLLTALDAMPAKRLVDEVLQDADGDVCLLGAGAKHRNVPEIFSIGPEDHDALAKHFDVAPCLIQEIEYINDEDGSYCSRESPESRFDRVRKWLVKNIAPPIANSAAGG